MTEQAPQLVVVGASAGGVEALSTLVGTLPADFPAPMVIAQHLDPTRLSHLPEILGRRSKLPVRSVVSQEPLQPGIVYVVPADHQVEITDHAVSVSTESGRSRPAPSIDRLLASAAEIFQEQLVAVILTGLGSDGADGARRVKELGGTVVIQNPQTASHPDMPLSLAPTIVDIVAELEAIGPLLNELLKGMYARARPDDEGRLRLLLDQVRTRSGIDFSAYKEPTIRRRLQRRILDTGNDSLEDYAQYLRRHPEEYARLANSFLIKVTDFFRDSDLFTELRHHLVPDLIAHAREHGNELRLWSAGCATGEEPYSLAILVSELLGDDFERFNVRIFATDLDADAVAFGRRGIYPASALSGLSADLRERYFMPVDSAFEVRKRVRGMVVFGQHDLGQRAPFPRMDLVMCRNVLIYFTGELQRRALQLFAFALREGGYLVLGKSESTSPVPEHFTLMQPRLKVFRRHGERVLIPQSRTGDAIAPTAAMARRPNLPHLERGLARIQARNMGDQTAAERAERVVESLPIGVVLVDRNYDILAINSAARRLLAIHTSAVGEDLVHVAHRSLGGALRDAIDAAIGGEPYRTIIEMTSLPDTPGEQRCFELSSFRKPAGDRPENEAIAVLVSDVTEHEQQQRARDAQLDEAQARAARLQHLLDESTRTVRELLTANQELTGANNALRSTSEELLVGNEEAQAAMEEIETLNEEQQASNEELETLNEELQATVEELNATNEDLQARSVELQDQAVQRESLLVSLTQERQRLSAILASMSDAVMLVDANGQPLLTNSAFEQTFGATLPQLQDASGQRVSSRSNPLRRAARGESFTQLFTLPGDNGSRRWFEATGQPIQTDRGIEGGVVVIRDVSDRSLRQLQEQFVALSSHELRTPLAALRGSLQLLERHLAASGTGSDARVSRHVTTALQQARLLEDLIADLTDVVRLQTGTLPVGRGSVDLVEVVQSSVELGRPLTEDHEIRLELPAEQIEVEGDRRRLQQVLLNLLANAIQHGSSPDGYTVRLRADGSDAVVEVCDYGPGIPEEEQARVFERFYQAGRAGGPGLGVGLYLVQAIVNAHGGSVRVHSTGERGSTFTVRLPRRRRGRGGASG